MLQRNMIYISMGLAVVFIAIGSALMFTNAYYYAIQHNRLPIGGLFAGYGMFRLVTSILKLKRRRFEDE